MKIVKIAVMLLLTSFCVAPFAQPVTSTTPMVDPDCIDSPDVCQERTKKRAERREALRQRCIKDPVWCEERRARSRQQREEKRALRQQCRANPEQCEALKQQFKHKQAQARKEQRQKRKEKRQKLKKAQKQWCVDNPQDCKHWKADMRALRKKYKEMLSQLQDQYPSRPR